MIFLRLIRQTTAHDCGPAVLAMLHNDQYRKQIGVNEILASSPSVGGDWSLADLQDAAEKLGLAMSCYACPVEELPKKVNVGETVGLLVSAKGASHFVVATRAKRGWRIMDPALGGREIANIAGEYGGVYFTCKRKSAGSSRAIVLSKNYSLGVRYLLTVLLLQGLAIAGSVVAGKYIQLVLTYAIGSDSVANLVSVSGTFLVLYAVNAVVGLLIGWVHQREVANAFRSNMAELVRLLSRKPAGFFATIDRSDLVTLDSHCHVWISHNTVGFTDLIADIAVLIVVSAVLGANGYALLIVALLAIIVICAISLVARSWRAQQVPVAKQELNGFRKTVGVISDIKIRGHNAAQSEIEAQRAVASLDRQTSLFKYASIGDGLCRAASSFAQSLFVVAAVVVGSLLLIDGKLDNIAQITYFVSLASMMTGAASGTMDWLSNQPNARQSLEILQKVRFIGDGKPQKGLAPNEQVSEIALDGLGYSYGPQRLIADMTETLGPGTIVTGQSGTGKTTLCRMLCGDLSPTAGNFLINGIKNSDLDGNWLRQNVVMLGNIPVLSDEDLAETASTQDKRLRLIMTAARITPQSLLTDSLSSGQRQLVAVARASTMSGKVILCDEALSHLDPATAELAMMFIVKEMCRKNFVVWVSHDDKHKEYFSNHLQMGVQNA